MLWRSKVFGLGSLDFDPPMKLNRLPREVQRPKVRLINQRSEPITEPSAVAPDAKLNSECSVNPSNYHHPNLSLASGATALGSVKPGHLSQVQTIPHTKYILHLTYRGR